MVSMRSQSSLGIMRVFALIATLFTSSLFAHAFSSNYAPIGISLPAFTKECLYYDLFSDEDVLVVSYQVLTGGNFEIDFDITAPDGSVIVTERQKKHSDFLLKSFGVGKYTFCLSNNYGTSPKKVEITLEKEKETVSSQERKEDIIANNAIEEIDRNLNKIMKTMDYLRAREWRNMYTVASTESRLTWLSLLIMGVMVGISICLLYTSYPDFDPNR